MVGGLVEIMEDYEAGYLDTGETLELFAELIRTGRAWNLARTLETLILTRHSI